MVTTTTSPLFNSPLSIISWKHTSSWSSPSTFSCGIHSCMLMPWQCATRSSAHRPDWFSVLRARCVRIYVTGKSSMNKSYPVWEKIWWSLQSFLDWFELSEQVCSDFTEPRYFFICISSILALWSGMVWSSCTCSAWCTIVSVPWGSAEIISAAIIISAHKHVDSAY